MDNQPQKTYLLAAQFIAFTLLLVLSYRVMAAPRLFGYQETPQQDTSSFTQWISMLERHLTEDLPPGDCDSPTLNHCHLQEWHRFLDSIRGSSKAKQLQAVNRYANNKRYVLDIDNYGLEDYWAVAREFLNNGGDCEDYAITKLFSLLWLGFPLDSLRVVVLQDTNLRVPHAILAYYHNNDILILDNQIQEVIDHRSIVHYVPVYAINEHGWWIYTPPS